jgi:isocitrate dehydrogenase (NAD+)
MELNSKKLQKITFIPGDGIGPEVMGAARKVIEASGVAIDFEEVEAGEKLMEKYGTPIPDYVLHSIEKNKIAWKGPVTTPVGKGFRSVNVTLRQKFNLYANLRPIKTYEGVPSRYDDVDLIIVRENTEDLYSGVEHMVDEDTAESIKIITRKASEKIVKFAFDLAVEQGRKKVTSVHKANIMKCTDGLFLNVSRDVAKKYDQVQFEDMIVDAMSMKLVMNPEKYDVLVMPNLYGDILSDMAAGFIGGLGLAPSGNIGEGAAIFEAIHGSAPDIAGKNIANPTACILSGVMLLRYLGEQEAANKIDIAIAKVLKEGIKTTPDLGGASSTDEFAYAVIEAMV